MGGDWIPMEVVLFYFEMGGALFYVLIGWDILW